MKKDFLHLSEIITKTLSITHATLVNNSIETILDIDDNITIQGYENELLQAFINIINNAKDAFLSQKIDDSKKYIFISLH